MLNEDARLGECGKSAAKAQFARRICFSQLLQEQFAESSRKDTHGQEEPCRTGNPSLLVKRQAPARDKAVQVGVMVQGLPLGMQHGDRADLGAKVAWIGSDDAEGLGCHSKQNGVDRRLALECDCGEGRRHGEDDVEIRDR